MYAYYIYSMTLFTLLLSPVCWGDINFHKKLLITSIYRSTHDRNTTGIPEWLPYKSSALWSFICSHAIYLYS